MHMVRSMQHSTAKSVVLGARFRAQFISYTFIKSSILKKAMLKAECGLSGLQQIASWFPTPRRMLSTPRPPPHSNDLKLHRRFKQENIASPRYTVSSSTRHTKAPAAAAAEAAELDSYRVDEDVEDGVLTIQPLQEEDVAAASVVLTRAFATSAQGIPIEDGRCVSTWEGTGDCAVTMVYQCLQRIYIIEHLFCSHGCIRLPADSIARLPCTNHPRGSS
jgi:hypothetical protein